MTATSHVFMKADGVHKYSINTKQLNGHFEHHNPLKTNRTGYIIMETTIKEKYMG